MFYLKDKNGGSFDMCFCESDCTNESCRRRKKSKHFEALQEYMKRHPYYLYAVSDFSHKCEEYKHE